MPTIDLPDDELAAVAGAIRRVIEADRYPHAPRLVPLLTALWKFEAVTTDQKQKAGPKSLGSSLPTVTRKATEPQPKAPPPAKADKRR